MSSKYDNSSGVVSGFIITGFVGFRFPVVLICALFLILITAQSSGNKTPKAFTFVNKIEFMN